MTTAVAMVVVATGVFFALTAIGVGGEARTVRRAPVTPAPRAVYHVGTPHVLSSITLYPVGGVFSTPRAQDPLRSASLFSQPIARYRKYSVEQLGVMEGQIARLKGALAANDRAAARTAWRAAYASYLRLGGVYLAGPVATLDQEIDGIPGPLAGGVASPHFTGLHRIEYGLWTATPPRALVGWASRLGLAVRKMRKVLPHVRMTPLEYATRAHEILEDAVRDLLSGAAVPWSGEGLLATEAGLEATEQVISTLRSVFELKSLVLTAVQAELAALRSAIGSIAAAHGGRLPTNGELTQRQSGLLNGTLGGTLEALALVPGALDTEPLPQFPPIPKHDARIDS